jgi:hypothetical protein
MSKSAGGNGKLALIFLLSFVAAGFCQAAPQLSTEDEIRAGDALFLEFQKSQGFADTPESKAIEAYLQKVGNKVAQTPSASCLTSFISIRTPDSAAPWAIPGARLLWEAACSL